ncbi:MAG: helix-turn-helix transcriptional regulator [Candidatus Aminicenantes bacterium]|nr:helix-turn-helix transcriptional regulator [Candidatus Aminicenantes bacterium]
MIIGNNSIKEDNITEQAVKLILSCNDEELKRLRLRDVAKAVDTFAALLYIKFIIEHKITFNRLVEREKIHRAIFYLDENPGLKIEDLSKKLGFPAIPVFEEKFEKYLLVKPERYKRLVMIRNSAS